MRLPPRAWKRTWTALGFSIRPVPRQKKHRDHRRSPLESLEPRQLLAADINLTDFRCYESAQLGNPHFFSGDNTDLAGFMRRLGTSGVLRI